MATETTAPVAEAKTPADEFMLEEYRTIAGAHFELHNGLRHTFRFYLTIVSLPLTVLALLFKDAKEVTPSIGQLPSLALALFLVMPLLGLMIFLSMVNTRFDIILYTRTINAIRGYFLERSKSPGAADIARHLNLPTDSKVPSYKERLRSDWWLFLMMAIINSVYAYVGALNIWKGCAASWVAFGVFLVHFCTYELLGWRREATPIVGVRPGSAT